MKRAATLVLFVLLFTGALVAQEKPQKYAVDYVDPNIGGIGQLLNPTIAYVQCPDGRAGLAPVPTQGTPARYLADKIFAFPAGPALLMASTRASGTQASLY